MMKIICVVAVMSLFSLNWAQASVENNRIDIPEFTYYNGVKVYKSEMHCALAGGVCVHTSDCKEMTSTRNLCPNNSKNGVECCYEMVVKPAPCEQYLGACMSRCHKTLMRPATDCDDGQVCCVLV